ncbi:MAG: TetR/AcrR family transcriptional regulator [Acidobacteriaceae bacterium]|nr:TetR/AcrR family transcriptional regulator [Acidobacteriaceae bacterium]
MLQDLNGRSQPEYLPLVREGGDEAAQRGRGRPRDEVARGRILTAALEILEEAGFANTTADAIAERAGASKATIYRWWPNKGAVLIEALREQVAQETPFPDTGDVARDIREQLSDFIALLTGRRGRIFKAFIAAAQSDAEFADAFRQVWIRPRREQAQALLRKHIVEGRLPADTDLEVVMDAIYGPIYFRLLAGHAPLTAEFAEGIATMALQALLNSGV